MNLSKLKNKKFLLETLFDIIEQTIDDGKMNIHLEEETSEFLMGVVDKKKIRKLKVIKKQLDDWIKNWEEI